MVTLGQKMTKGALTLGQKIDKHTHVLGRKTHNTLNKINQGIVSSDVILRKADHTIDRLEQLGGNNMPGPIGQALMAASGAVKSGRVASQMAKEVSANARIHANALEKFNSRKFANEAIKNQAQNSAQNGYA